MILYSVWSAPAALLAAHAAGGVDRAPVGWGMVPRGEVGLIFAMVGKQLGVVSEQIFAVIVTMVILTTAITPLALVRRLRRHHALGQGPAVASPALLAFARTGV